MGKKEPKDSFLKSKLKKLIHKASKNENQPPPENRTRIDSNEQAWKWVGRISRYTRPHSKNATFGNCLFLEF
jgi:hypothetical protein